MSNVVYIKQDRCWTDSRKLAEVFGKRHADVIRSIKTRLPNIAVEFNGRNFALVEFTDSKGERRSMYEMTRDGFAIIAMGFTGKKAEAFKVSILEEFNRRGEELEKRGQKVVDVTDPDVIIQLAQKLKDETKRANLATMRADINETERAKAEEKVQVLDFKRKQAENDPVHHLQVFGVTGKELYDLDIKSVCGKYSLNDVAESWMRWDCRDTGRA